MPADWYKPYLPVGIMSRRFSLLRKILESDSFPDVNCGPDGIHFRNFRYLSLTLTALISLLSMSGLAIMYQVGRGQRRVTPSSCCHPALLIFSRCPFVKLTEPSLRPSRNISCTFSTFTMMER